jgi:hypothetical protein
MWWLPLTGGGGHVDVGFRCLMDGYSELKTTQNNFVTYFLTINLIKKCSLNYKRN